VPGVDNKRLTFAADSKPRKRCSPASLVSMTGTCKRPIDQSSGNALNLGIRLEI